jgi:hypothetical protein
MNHAQRQLVWSGAVAAALLGVAATKELSKPGLNCKDQLEGFVDRRGRWVMVKSQICD